MIKKYRTCLGIGRIVSSKTMEKKVTVGGYYIDDGYSYRTLVHCAYGWKNGFCDGYYLIDCFNVGEGPIIGGSDKRSDVNDFNYNTQIITYTFN